MTITPTQPVPLGIGDAAAWITKRDRVRLQRMQRHLAVAVLAGFLFTVLLATGDSLLEAAFIPVSAAVALQSLARGLSAGFGYMWGWPYPDPKDSTRLDRWVHGVLLRLASAPGRNHGSPDTRIRLLDPWDD